MLITGNNMNDFRATDLVHSYEWNTSESACKKVMGFPEDLPFNRNDGYEMLHFINRYMDDIGWATRISFNHIECIIHKTVPVNVNNHKAMKAWVDSIFKGVGAAKG
jgi:hypothetical protein